MTSVCSFLPKRCILSAICIALSVGFVATLSADEQKSKSRSFDFHYGATVTGLEPGKTVRVWVPLPSDSENQSAEIQSMATPGRAKIARDKKYQNRILYFEAQADEKGEIQFENVYRIRRHEIRKRKTTNAKDENRLEEKLKQQFLRPNAKVPVDGRPLRLLEGLKFQTEEDASERNVRLLYDRVLEHMNYDKSQPGYGNGDVIWACDSRTGNCTDFHSLFISLARSKQVPAKFEIGFPIPANQREGKIGGYHCWAHFHVDGSGWIPVDISEADKHPELEEYYFGNLTENRVGFSQGRDIELVPPQSGAPLNYFIYPYVEVDGNVWPKKTIETRFRFRDVK